MPAATRTSSNAHLATVVVATRDRCASCLETLASLARQTDDCFQVLVVDNGCVDGTCTAVEALAGGFPVPLRLVHEPEPGISAARNRALKEADAELFVFLDDDVTCAPQLVAAYVEAFEDPRVVAAGGRIVPELPGDVDDLVRKHAARPYGGPCAAYDLGKEERCITNGLPAPFGGNMAVRTRTLRELGGFRTDLGWGPSGVPGEETELFRRIAALPGDVRYVPRASVGHRVQREKLTREYFLSWYRAQGLAVARMARTERGPVRRWLGAGEQALRIVRYGRKRSHARDAQLRFDLDCKLERARGKLAGLVGRP